MSYELHINFISDMNSPYRIMTKKNENSKQRVIFYPANNVKKNCWRDDVKNLGQSYVAKVCVCVYCVYVCVQNVATKSRSLFHSCLPSLVRSE